MCSDQGLLSLIYVFLPSSSAKPLRRIHLVQCSAETSCSWADRVHEAELRCLSKTFASSRTSVRRVPWNSKISVLRLLNRPLPTLTVTTLLSVLKASRSSLKLPTCYTILRAGGVGVSQYYCSAVSAGCGTKNTFFSRKDTVH